MEIEINLGTFGLGKDFVFFAVNRTMKTFKIVIEMIHTEG